ncbi:hypothetical protein [Desulfosarcina sp.]|uniref:hypothetical protein n=1 Tax=Desulfosarcina sp. TaxID=2027861 RepID=UPI0029ADE450|nr:hypothetical protein [Desulfosarcina sp.]MDX2453724.1 hypothetical protein [Desulfosarcina sp.]MDX2491418.1 hypothetical protein [Desulfosarcina sp.]
MKTTGFKPKIVTVLATLAFFSISAPTIVSEFFPLDVWEEIEAWEQTTMAALDPDIAVHNEATPLVVDDAEMVNASFPFDVWEELNDHGGNDWSALKNWKAFNLNYGTAKEDRTNPYWLPEELRNR